MSDYIVKTFVYFMIFIFCLTINLINNKVELMNIVNIHYKDIVFITNPQFFTYNNLKNLFDSLIYLFLNIDIEDIKSILIDSMPIGNFKEVMVWNQRW